MSFDSSACGLHIANSINRLPTALGGKMPRQRLKGERALWSGLLGVAMILSLSRLTVAQVQYYINLQPIDVCTQDGACAPTSEPGGQIGFSDSSGANITRAILNQAGIDVNFLPVQTITSPADLTQ